MQQLADGAEIMAGCYAASGPNENGLDCAIAVSTDEVAVFASASEGFSGRNINCSVAESLLRFEPVFLQARVSGLPARTYVFCVTDCPCDGETASDAVAKIVARFIEIGRIR